MSLPHAILALLAEAPKSGYDLSKCFESTVSHYWKASAQQIYRELGKLEAAGAVESTLVPQTGRPDKRVYRIAEAGRDALLQWLLEPADPAPIRESLLVKILAGYRAPRDELAAEVRRRRSLHAEQLARYRELERREFARPETLPPEQQFRYLTLRRGIYCEQSWVDWCDEVLPFIERFGGD